MYLEVSAMYLLELHRAIEADRRRGSRDVLHRQAMDDATAFRSNGSATLERVPLDDRRGRPRDPSPDLGRSEHLYPAARAEQPTGRLIRPVQPQPEP